jgi:hypothetical protein
MIIFKKKSPYYPLTKAPVFTRFVNKIITLFTDSAVGNLMNIVYIIVVYAFLATGITACSKLSVPKNDDK